MNAREAVQLGINQSDTVVTAYLGDLTDADLLVRPVPGANHIAWQLGHLLVADQAFIEAVCPGVAPPLPPGFKEKYSKETSQLDAAAAFHPKSVYMSLYDQLRAAARKALEKISDSDLDKPSPDSFKAYAPTHGDLLTLIGGHWLMHAGQWAVIRRKLGKPPLF